MRYMIPRGEVSPQHRQIVQEAISSLSDAKTWVVEVKQYRKKRSLEQNSFLHAVPLRMICDETGYDMDDMKTYLLGEFFGWEEFEIMGSPRKRPFKRSHELNRTEFMHWLDWIEMWGARELGMIIPKPNEVVT